MGTVSCWRKVKDLIAREPPKETVPLFAFFNMVDSPVTQSLP